MHHSTVADKRNKFAFLFVPAPIAYVVGLGHGSSGFTTGSVVILARGGSSAGQIADTQASRDEELVIDDQQFQDPENEYGLLATYEHDDKTVDQEMD